MLFLQYETVVKVFEGCLIRMACGGHDFSMFSTVAQLLTVLFLQDIKRNHLSEPRLPSLLAFLKPNSHCPVIPIGATTLEMPGRTALNRDKPY